MSRSASAASIVRVTELEALLEQAARRHALAAYQQFRHFAERRAQANGGHAQPQRPMQHLRQRALEIPLAHGLGRHGIHGSRSVVVLDRKVDDAQQVVDVDP